MMKKIELKVIERGSGSVSWFWEISGGQLNNTVHICIQSKKYYRSARDAMRGVTIFMKKFCVELEEANEYYCDEKDIIVENYEEQ